MARVKSKANKMREFFSGLEEMQEFLRRPSTPEVDTAALLQMANGLARPRDLKALTTWLCTELSRLFVAQAVELFVKDTAWRCIEGKGEVSHVLLDTALQGVAYQDGILYLGLNTKPHAAMLVFHKPEIQPFDHPLVHEILELAAAQLNQALFLGELQAHGSTGSP